MALRDALHGFVEKMMRGAYIKSPRFDDYEIIKIEDVGADAAIDAELRDAVRQEIKAQTKDDRSIKETKDQVDLWKSGNVEKINRMSNIHFGNIRNFARNPFGFLFSLLFKRLFRLFSIAGLILIFFEIVRFVISELMKPGRALDRRFKRDMQREIFLFWSHQEQEKLKRGFIDVRVTTKPGLRGGLSQVSGNLFTHEAVSGTLGPPTGYLLDTNYVGLPPTPNSSATRNGNPRWRGAGSRR